MFTDRTDVFLSVRSEESFQCGYDTRRATLYLRCMDNTTAALLVTDCFMADIQGFGRVRYYSACEPNTMAYCEPQ